SDDPTYPSDRGVTIHAIAVDPADSSRIYAAFALGAVGPPAALRDGSVVIGSADRGRNWTRLATLAPERVFALSVEGDHVLALAETGAWEGVGAEWKHFDGPPGARFETGSIGHGPGGPVLYATTKTAWRGNEVRARQMGRDIWYDAPYDLAAAPNDPDICYVTDLFRTYRTLDGGKTWNQVHSAPRGPAGWTTRGLDVTSSYGVHFDPFDAKR